MERLLEIIRAIMQSNKNVYFIYLMSYAWAKYTYTYVPTADLYFLYVMAIYTAHITKRYIIKLNTFLIIINLCLYKHFFFYCWY